MMTDARPLGRYVPPLVILVSLWTGCMAPRGPVAQMATRSRNLDERNRALEARVAALQAHAETLNEKLLLAEQNLALADDRQGVGRRQMANLEREREFLQGQIQGIVAEQGTAGMAHRLAWLSSQSEHLSFDSRLGVAKLDTDFLFDVGNDQLKPGADAVLRDLTRLLNRPEARDFRVLVVGHTDDHLLAGADMRNRFAGDNFRLSTARAHVVRERLEQSGLAGARVGVAGYGAHQPIAVNNVDAGRERNRRVEVFVIAPSVPVVGWTETTPFLYY